MLLNRGSAKAKMAANWKEIGLPEGDAVVRDLWKKEDLGTFTDSFTATVNPHSSYLLKKKKKK